MAWRVVTPSDIHLSVPCPQPESPTKRKGTRSQRRSRASESDVDGHPGQQTDKSHEVHVSLLCWPTEICLYRDDIWILSSSGENNILRVNVANE